MGSAVLALYLNVFVGVAQAFDKFPVLTRLAPTQSEPPLLVAQLAVLVIFAVQGLLAVMRFWPSHRAGGGARVDEVGQKR